MRSKSFRKPGQARGERGESRSAREVHGRGARRASRHRTGTSRMSVRRDIKRQQDETRPQGLTAPQGTPGAPPRDTKRSGGASGGSEVRSWRNQTRKLPRPWKAGALRPRLAGNSHQNRARRLSGKGGARGRSGSIHVIRTTYAMHSRRAGAHRLRRLGGSDNDVAVVVAIDARRMPCSPCRRW